MSKKIDEINAAMHELSLIHIFDAEDFISDAYILEVSSPGLGRPLKKEKDFKRSLGKSVECKLYLSLIHIY